MFHFEYHKKSEVVVSKAREQYGRYFDLSLSDESIEARYYLLEYLRDTYAFTGSLSTETTGKPIPIIIDSPRMQIYWSISHSHNYTAFIVSDAPTGIDIAEIEARDISILDVHPEEEYSLLGGRNWLNFYILWTAKESIIKVKGGILEDMKDIHIELCERGGISIFAFRDGKHKIKTNVNNSNIISFTL